MRVLISTINFIIGGGIVLNKIGIYYGYWTKDWIVDFSKYVKKVESLGFDVIEFDMSVIMESPKKYQKSLKKALAESDLEVSFCTSLPENKDISSGYTKKRVKGIDYLKKSIKKVDEFGGEALSGILYGIWGDELKPGEDKSPYLQRSIESMKEVAKTAENYDVQCNMEVVNRFEQFMLNTSKEGVEYVNKVDSSHVNILLDTYHMNIEEDSFAKAIKTAGEKLGHFHIGANNRKLPGDGHLDWEEIIGTLNEINYDGKIVMEPFVLNGGDIAQDIKIWRNMDPKNKDEKAEKSRKFIKQLLE